MPTWSTDIERITDKWHTPYSVSRFALLLILTWFVVFGIYVGSIAALDSAAGHPPTGEFIDPADYAFVAYGLGALLATLLTPLFGILSLMSALEAHGEDKGLVRAFLKVDSVRAARRMKEKRGRGHQGGAPGGEEPLADDENIR